MDIHAQGHLVQLRHPDHRVGLVIRRSTGDFYSGPTAERRENGYLVALDARNGKLLWERSLAGAVHSTPMTYSVGGTQYIAVTGGNNLFVFAIRR